MIIDTEKLLAAIDQYESNEIPNWETCPISKLNRSEKRGLTWRKTISDFCALAESFPEAVVFCMAGEVDFSKKLNK